MNKEFIKIDEAARLVGKSEVTIRRAIKANHLFVSKEETKSGFNYLIHKDSLLKYYEVAPSHDEIDKANEQLAPNQMSRQETTHDLGEELNAPSQKKKEEKNQTINYDQADYAPPWFTTNFAAYFETLANPYKETLKILQEELKKRDDQIKVKDGQLAKKDEHIGVLLERLREGNILLARTQNIELKAPSEEGGMVQEVSPIIDTESVRPENYEAGKEKGINTEIQEALRPIEDLPKTKGFWKKFFWGE